MRLIPHAVGECNPVCTKTDNEAPSAHIDHDTFKLFDCGALDPTFAYTYEEAVSHEPPFLCDFEVLRVRSKF